MAARKRKNHSQRLKALRHQAKQQSKSNSRLVSSSLGLNIKSAQQQLNAIYNKKPEIGRGASDYNRNVSIEKLKLFGEVKKRRKSFKDLYTSIISENTEKVNKHKQAVATEFFEEELGIDYSLIASEVLGAFDKSELKNVRSLYNLTVEHINNHAGIDSLMNEVSAYFDEEHSSRFLKEEYYEEALTDLFEDDTQDFGEFRRLYDELDAELYKYVQGTHSNISERVYEEHIAMLELQKKQIVKEVEAKAQAVIEEYAENMTNDVARAYVIDSIKVNGGIKNVLIFGNKDAINNWLDLKHAILYGLDNTSGAKFGSAPPNQVTRGRILKYQEQLDKLEKEAGTTIEKASLPIY